MVVVGSPTTDLLQCERYFPNSDQNKAENLIARLQVTIDLVRGFLDSRGGVEGSADLGTKYLYLSWSFSGIQCDLPGLKRRECCWFLEPLFGVEFKIWSHFSSVIPPSQMRN